MSDAAEDPGHVFDQTNGVADGLEGESDGTARGDEESRREQEREDFDGTAANIVAGRLGSRAL